MPETISQTTPVARKQHTCDVCGCPIEPGTKYVRSINKMDDVYTFVEHEDCREVGCASIDLWYTGDEGYTDESVTSWLIDHEDHLSDIQRGVLARIRARWANVEERHHA